MRGFRPPPPGTAMCQHLVAHDSFGRLRTPRACKRAAVSKSSFCGLHARITAKTPHIDVFEGGYCIGCGMPGRRYIVGGVTIALCVPHQNALERALREGR